MIQVEHLTKLYGPKTAIADVSFSVDKGEVLAFLGPNGAGKTTTMRILTASLPATSGSAKVAGYDCFDQPTEVKRLIGYLPEVPPLYTEMTVTEYLTFVGRIKGIEPERLPVALDQILERLSLGDVRGRLIANLSRGFQQRVGLAQALIHDPPVLILGHPPLGPDPKPFLIEAELGHDLREDLAHCAARNDWGLVELKLVAMTLEDVFLRLTTEEDTTTQPEPQP